MLLQRVLDAIPVARSVSDLARPLALYAGATLLNHLLIYLDGYPRAILNHGAYHWVKARALRKVATVDYLAYQDLGTGRLIERVEQGASATQRILMDFWLALVRNFIPQIAVSLILVRRYDTALFAVFLGLVAVLTALSSVLMRALSRQVERMLARQESLSKYSVRGMMELVVFRVNNRFAHELRRVRAISDSIIRSQASIRLVQELLFTGFAVLSFAITLVVIVRQADLIIAGASTIGALVALTALIQQAVSPISHFSVALTQYRQDRIAFARFAELLDLPDDPALLNGAPLKIERGELALDGVSFAYGDRQVLDGLDLALEPARTTALVGVSGAGKSTVVKLLLGLLKPQSGRVLVDGVDLASADLASCYAQVAYIPQEPPVFDGTIRENLAFDATMSDAALTDAAAKAGLCPLIERLPQGLDTVVGERGAKLSGGERQRLAYARLLIQQPRIVVMDEPTASLDSLTEAAVADALTSFLEGRTVVVIAHRIQTVRAADRIVVLDDGRIVQDGDFDSLVEAPGVFRDMWLVQAGSDGDQSESDRIPARGHR